MKNTEYVYKHPNTVWESIKNQLEIDIMNNVYKTGERVPSTIDLAEKYNVSVKTAGKALEYLKNEEIIMMKKGIGFFVLPYAKSKIIKEMRTDFKKQLYDIINFAKTLEYTNEEIVSMVNTMLQ